MKIGLLGGSFDPPHFGHIGISKDALKLLNLDEIWWLPTKQNPLKTHQSRDFEKRFFECQEITKNENQIIVRDDEKKLESPYFIDLLQEIQQKNPQHEYFLLIGTDNLINFHLWKNWQEIINLAQIVVLERNNFDPEILKNETVIFCQNLEKQEQKPHLIFLKNNKYNISSTGLRSKMNKFNFIVDSHCHLDLIEEKGANIDEIVKAATENKVAVLQTICTRISKFPEIYSYTQKYENVFASIGNHPCNVGQEKMTSAQEIIDLCNSHKKLIGIGETGLDYFHDASLKELQIQSLLQHIEAARVTELPLIIHNRDSDLDMIEILKREMQKGKFKALLHCFSSGKELATEALKLGIYVSISGIVTFKNAVALQEIVKELPLDKLLVETDSPYLAPTPYRGQSNQPSYTRNTAEFIAELRGISADKLFTQTTRNFFDLFSKCSINFA